MSRRNRPSHGHDLSPERHRRAVGPANQVGPGEGRNHWRPSPQPVAGSPAPHTVCDLSWRYAMKSKALVPFFLCAAALAAIAGAQQTVDDLLPRLAAERVEDRYSAQMELQKLALNAGRLGAEGGRLGV